MGGFGQNLPHLAGVQARQLTPEQKAAALKAMSEEQARRQVLGHPQAPAFQDPLKGYLDKGAEQFKKGVSELTGPSDTTAANPAWWDRKAQGASDVIRGSAPMASLAALPLAAVNPAGALLGLGAGLGAQAGVEKLAEKANVPPGTRALLGDVAGLAGGAIGGETSLQDLAGMGKTAAGAVKEGLTKAGEAFDEFEFGEERGSISGKKVPRVENAAGVNVRGAMGGKGNKLYYPLQEDIEALAKKMNPENPKKAERNAFSALRWRNYDKPAAEKEYGPLVRAAATDSRLERLQNTPEAVQSRIQDSRIILAKPLPLWAPKDYGIFDRKLIQQALQGFPGVPQTRFPRSTPMRADISHVDEIYLDPVNREMIKTMIKRGLRQGGETWYASLYPLKAEVVSRNLKSNYFPQVGGELFDHWVWGVTPASARNSAPVERSVGNFLRNLVARGVKIKPISPKIHNPGVLRELAAFKQRNGMSLQLMPVHAELASRVLEQNLSPFHVLTNNLTDSYKIPTYGVQTTGDFAFSWVGDTHEAYGETLGTRYNPYFRDNSDFGVNEYGRAEQHMLDIAKELSLVGGQAQAGRWFGGGDITGLKTPGGDALDLYELQVAYSLDYWGKPTDPKSVQNYFMKLIQEGGDLIPWTRKSPIPDKRRLR